MKIDWDVAGKKVHVDGVTLTWAIPDPKVFVLWQNSMERSVNVYRRIAKLVAKFEDGTFPSYKDAATVLDTLMEENNKAAEAVLTCCALVGQWIPEKIDFLMESIDYADLIEFCRQFSENVHGS